jgi:hypothetical protein
MASGEPYTPSYIRDLCEDLITIIDYTTKLFVRVVKTYPIEEAEEREKISSREMDNVRALWINFERAVCAECRRFGYHFKNRPYFVKVRELLLQAVMSTMALASQANLNEQLEIDCRLEFLQQHMSENINMTCDPNVMP